MGRGQKRRECETNLCVFAALRKPQLPLGSDLCVQDGERADKIKDPFITEGM